MGKRVLCFFLVGITMISLGIVYPSVAQAATYNNSKSQTLTDKFAVPGGGYSVITSQTTYRERYTKSGNNDKFSRREKSYVYKTAYSTTRPKINLSHVKHSNGKTFTSWTKGSIMYGSPWQGGTLYYNTTSVTYPKNTSVTGTLYYQTTCSGALVPTKHIIFRDYL